MGDISSVVLPSGGEYFFKDSSAIEELSFANGILTQTKRDSSTKRIDLNGGFLEKTYTGLLGAASNTAATDSFYFMKLRPVDFYSQWKVHYSIEAIVDGHPEFHLTSDVTLYGIGQEAAPVQYIFNRLYSITYIPYFFHNFYRLTSSGFSKATLCNAVGIGLRGSSYHSTAGYERTIVVKVYDAIDCDVELLDTPVKWGDWTEGTTVNYVGLTEYNGYLPGLQETGDRDTYDRRYTGIMGVSGGAGVLLYTLVMQDSEGLWQSIVTSSTAAANKQVNSIGFKLETLYYYNSSTVNVNTRFSNSLYDSYPTIDFRYSSNCGKTLTAYEAVYLVGRFVDGLFYVDPSIYTQALPVSDSDKVYVYIGHAVSTYQVAYQPIHPIYVYKYGRVMLYEEYQTKKLEELMYEPINVLSFSVQPGVVEKGSSVSNVDISYEFNKIPASATLNGDALPISASGSDTLTFDTPITTDTVFTLQATDAGSATRSPVTVQNGVLLEFANNIYYGVKSGTAVSEAFVKSLSESVLSNDRTRTISLDSTKNTYVWYAYPSNMGASRFVVGGLEGGFEEPVVATITNTSGFTESYYIYRSTNHSLGEVEIIIK